jgi:hypothetical protein
VPNQFLGGSTESAVEAVAAIPPLVHVRPSASCARAGLETGIPPAACGSGVGRCPDTQWSRK